MSIHNILLITYVSHMHQFLEDHVASIFTLDRGSIMTQKTITWVLMAVKTSNLALDSCR